MNHLAMMPYDVACARGVRALVNERYPWRSRLIGGEVELIGASPNTLRVII